MVDLKRVSWLVLASLLFAGVFQGCGGSTDEEPAVPATPVLHTPRFNGSFMQGAMITSFNDGQWRTEFKCMKAAGVDQLFLQWTMDSKAMTAMYPSTLQGVTMTKDGVTPCLSNAKVAGIDVYLGLQSNADWWTNYAWDGEWLDAQAAISNQLADDLWKQYGASPAFKGWFIWFEADNVNHPSSTEWDNLARYYKTVCDHLHALSPGKKVIVAPFFTTNPSAGGLSSSDWQSMWEYVLERAPIDVIALQDGVGVGHATVDQLPEWFEATKNAITASGASCELWADTENFLGDQPMTLDQVVADMKAVQPYVSNYLSFSFNLYTSPQTANPFFYTTYLDYVWKGALENSAPGIPGGVTGTAVDSTSARLRWTVPADNIGVVGYIVYRDGEAFRVDSTATTYNDYNLEASADYIYQVAAFDAAGNISDPSDVLHVVMPADPVYATNLADGKPYTIDPAPGDTYPDDGVKLTDGVKGTADWSSDTAWVGSLEASYSILVDLGSVQTINEVNSNWLQDQASWIFFPDSVTYFVSENGTDFTRLGSASELSSPDFYKKCKLTNLSVSGQYVRIDVASSGWSFVDEVEVRQQ